MPYSAPPCPANSSNWSTKPRRRLSNTMRWMPGIVSSPASWSAGGMKSWRRSRQPNNDCPASMGNDGRYLPMRMRIPAKPNSIPEGSRTGFRADPEQPSERSDAGLLIVQEVFGLVKEAEVRSEAEEGGNRQGKGGRGKGQRALSPLGTAENPGGP